MRRGAKLESAPDVRRAAMDLLARREHSGLELRRKLTGRVEDASLIESVIAELAAEGLQSDARFAESLAASLAGRGKGPVAIRAEFRKRGVDEDVAACAFESVDGDWVARARAARRKRFGEQPPGEHRERARQARFLQSRGFTSGQIGAALDDCDD